MATFLDAGILSGFPAVFLFLLVYAIIFGILTYAGIFKLSKGLSAIIAFVIAFFTLMSPTAVRVIRIVTPWYVVFFLVIFFIVLGAMIFGGAEGGLKALMGNNYASAVITVIIISVLIFFAGLGQVFLDEGNSTGDGVSSEKPYFLDILVNPQVLGVIVVFVVAALAIILLANG